MPWNPETYDKFKSERQAPFYDLLALLTLKPNVTIIDLGCGTGELTRKLADHFPGSDVVGIDASEEMLKKAKALNDKSIHFECRTIEEVARSDKKWDIVFSNAAIHWVDNHAELLPKLIKIVNNGGELAIQVPSNHDHFTHTAIKLIASTAPFNTALKNWTRTSPVLLVEAYTRLLQEIGGKEITVFEKTYPHTLKDVDSLIEWMKGTAMIPYLERLPEELHQQFLDKYKELLFTEWKRGPISFPFKRIFMRASF